MEPSVDTAIRRVALILRLLGALWMVLLTVVLATTGSLTRPLAVWIAVAAGTAWALLAWRAGLIVRPDVRHADAVVAADVLVSGALTVVPALLGEPEGFSGGYPFGSLVVAMALRGQGGAVFAAVALSLLWVVRIAALGAVSLPFAVSNVLLYALSTVALVLGVGVLRRNEQRVREAEAALAVAQERAATASHLHDSVLQTLALVQRRAEEPNQVRALSRRQERELRAWLYGEAAQEGRPGTLGAALAAAAEDVLERYGVRVAVVAPGAAASLPIADGVEALAAAAREAMVNAADHAEVTSVDVFAEVDGGQVRVFVRDRGIGFDPEAVPGDRQGLRGSIHGRMTRAGGTAAVSSGPGRGTEVQLSLPLPAAG